MRHFVLERTFPASVREAYAWLTDYSADDSSIFGDPAGGRKVMRLSDHEFHLKGRYPGSRLMEETHVLLLPPDRWKAEGTLRYWRFDIAAYSQRWRLDATDNCSTLHMEVDVDITSAIARFYLFFRPGFVEQEIVNHYDRIVAAFTHDSALT